MNTAVLPRNCLAVNLLLTEICNRYQNTDYSEFYPVNLGFSKFENSNNLNVESLFSMVLAGPNGEKVTYKLIRNMLSVSI